MFYEGDLQGGIALALRDAKRVVCFIRDDEEESRTWEHEYLANKEISELLAAKSVALRLTAGTQEVGFLSSFCPINKVPTLVVINNGVLQEYIVSGTSEEEWKRRLRLALKDKTTVAASPQTEQLRQQQQQQEENQAPPATQPSIPTTSTSSRFDSTVQEPRSTGEDNAAERSKREDIRRGKRPADNVDNDSRPEADHQKQNAKVWKQQQRKREQQEKEERQRVLARIRHDKEERKAKEEERKLLSSAAQTRDDDTAGNVTEPDQRRPDKPATTTRSAQSQFRIQVRVFDGSSIRSSFSPSQTIRAGVRPWIDSQRDDGDAPYTLKQILTPLPNRTISVAEEDHTLDQLDLGATASLVMVPVQTYTEAYADNQSLSVRVLYAGYNLVASTVGVVTGVVGTFLGRGQGQPEGTSQDNTGGPPPESSSAEGEFGRRNAPGPRTAASNVRTLYSQRSEQRNDQLYNGNQLNFEPRKDETKDN